MEESAVLDELWPNWGGTYPRSSGSIILQLACKKELTHLRIEPTPPEEASKLTEELASQVLENQGILPNADFPHQDKVLFLMITCVRFLAGKLKFLVQLSHVMPIMMVFKEVFNEKERVESGIQGTKMRPRC